VVVGTFDPPTGYNQGVITPTLAPTVFPAAIRFRNHGMQPASPAPQSTAKLIGGYYVMKNKTVTRVGTGGDFYVQVPNSAPTAEFRIDIDSVSTTGITRPTVGQVLDIYGVLDELSSTLRALRPGSG